MVCCYNKEKDDNNDTKIAVKNRWRLMKKLGSGSFGVVYEVVDIMDE